MRKIRNFIAVLDYSESILPDSVNSTCEPLLQVKATSMADKGYSNLLFLGYGPLLTKQLIHLVCRSHKVLTALLEA